MAKKRLVKIALGQFQVIQGDTQANLKKMLDMTDKAAEAGADLVVFPELAYTGYFLESYELQKLAEPQDGPFVQQLRKKAKEKRIHIIAGYAEAGTVVGKMYNSCIFVDDEGRVIENMRKVYAWGQEKLKFCEGKRFEPPLPGCRRHFPDRTVCMPARQSMRVCICDDLHFHFHSPLHYIYYLYPPAKTGSNKTSSGKTSSSMPRSCAIKQYITFLREYNFLSRGY